jgi:hypothetical protein
MSLKIEGNFTLYLLPDPSLNHIDIMRNFKESIMMNKKLKKLNISSKKNN